MAQSKGNPMKTLVSKHTRSKSVPPSIDEIENFFASTTRLAEGEHVVRVTPKSGVPYVVIRPIVEPKQPSPARGAKAFVINTYARYLKLGKTRDEAQRLIALIAETEGITMAELDAAVAKRGITVTEPAPELVGAVA